MTVRATPLLVAPDNCDTMMGTPMLSHDLITGLRRINSNLVVPDADDRFRTAQFKGITSLWHGAPLKEGSDKVCAFHLGPIPEFTLVDGDGVMVTRGWRAIFWKLEKAGYVTQTQLERQFRVNLDYNRDSSLCSECVRQGVREPHNGGAMRRCDFHDDLYQSIQQGKKDGPELKHQSEWSKTKEMFT